MAITQEDIQQVLNAVKAASQGVQELETVDTLDGVNSLPGVKGSELVGVPMELLGKPAKDAAATANAAADAAAAAAQAAEGAAETPPFLYSVIDDQYRRVIAARSKRCTVRQMSVKIDGVALLHPPAVFAAADGVVDFALKDDEELLAVVLEEFPLFVARAVFDQKGVHFAVGFFEGEGEVADPVLSGLVAVDELPVVEAAEHIFRTGVLPAEQLDHFDAERRGDQVERAKGGPGAEIFQPGDVSFAQPGAGGQLVDGELLLVPELFYLVCDVDQIHPVPSGMLFVYNTVFPQEIKGRGREKSPIPG